MSSKDDKSDLSNLKSRLGLNKKKKSTESSDDDTSSPGGGGDSPAKGGRGASSGRGGRGGGVDDRLAALKKSTLGDDDESDDTTGGQPGSAAGGGQPQAGGPAAGGSGPASSPGAATGPQGPGAGQQQRQPGGGAAASGGHASPQPSASTGQSASGPAPGAGAPGPGQGPPPGAKGPPPTAQRGPGRGGSTSTASSRGRSGGTGGDEIDPAGEDVDLDDLDDIDLSEIGVDDNSILSGPVIGILVAALAVGVIFGFLISTSQQTRDIEHARINDAQTLLEEVEPRLDEFQEAHGVIEELAEDPKDVDFERTEQLAEFEFAIQGGILPGNRILLGDDVIGPFNYYMGASRYLQNLIADHLRQTRRDAEELHNYMEELDRLDENEQIAVAINPLGAVSHFSDYHNEEEDVERGDYRPDWGNLVRVQKRPEGMEIDEDDERFPIIPDEDGEVVTRPLSPRLTDLEAVGEEDEDDVDTLPVVRLEDQFVPQLALYPIRVNEFIEVETNNALQRYEQRVEQLANVADSLSGRASALRTQLDDAANADPPPIFALTGGEDPTEAYTEPEEDDVAGDPSEDQPDDVDDQADEEEADEEEADDDDEPDEEED